MARGKGKASRAGRAGSPDGGSRQAARVRAAFVSRPVLLLAFAFAVMGDPVSSVAYAMEAGLRSLGGHLALLLPTMLVVLVVIVLVAVNYHQLYAIFPEGGGDAAASAVAFSEGLAFLPLAALIVDYALTIAISAAAGASAIIAYLPRLAPARLPLAVVLLVVVAWADPVRSWRPGGLRGDDDQLRGHRVRGDRAWRPGGTGPPGGSWRGARLRACRAAGGAARLSGRHGPGDRGGGAVVGDRAAGAARRRGPGAVRPHHAVAHGGDRGLANRGPHGRRCPAGRRAASPRSTWMAQVAQAAVGRGALFAAFQLASAVLLLAAASSSFQAGPGLLKALARGGGGVGILPAVLLQPQPSPHPLLGSRGVPRPRLPFWWWPPMARNSAWCCSTRWRCLSRSGAGWPR